VNFAILYLFKQGNGFSLIKTPYNFIFFLLLLMENLILFKTYIFFDTNSLQIRQGRSSEKWK